MFGCRTCLHTHQKQKFDMCCKRGGHSSFLFAGMKQQAKGGMKPWYGTAPGKGGVDILHMSPPCQAMSKVNMHANVATIKKEMVPLLDQVCLPLHCASLLSSRGSFMQ